MTAATLLLTALSLRVVGKAYYLPDAWRSIGIVRGAPASNLALRLPNQAILANGPLGPRHLHLIIRVWTLYDRQLIKCKEGRLRSMDRRRSTSLCEGAAAPT